MMPVPDLAIQLIASFESCRLRAYQDGNGVWTIGYGHTCGVKEGDTCTEEQARAWLADDAKFAAQYIDHVVQVPLGDHQFAALISLVFNIGVGAFHSSRVLKFLNLGNFDDAALAFLLWDEIGHKDNDGLLARRHREMDVFTGKGISPAMLN